MTTISSCLPTALWTCGWIGAIVGERLGISPRDPLRLGSGAGRVEHVDAVAQAGIDVADLGEMDVVGLQRVGKPVCGVRGAGGVEDGDGDRGAARR